MRLFIAVLPDNGIKDEIYMIQRRLQLQGAEADFVTRENMHLTLAFIGEYKDPGYVSDVLGDVYLEPARIVIDGFGVTEDRYWAGIRENQELEANVKRIRKALADNGIPFDRRKFSPHITVARNMIYEKGLPADSPFPAAMEAESICLMRSDRGKNGMIYSVIDEFMADDAAEDEDGK
ncbi:MAG: RNA 2',3'-cyclic phosphodiesterase [Lachnospiraceae bacterium]|nr:RNA 2',3'-cyclic phosphodiesterase [Lachnospiraceae bacterium]